MDVEKKWKKITELGEFSLEKKGEKIRTVDCHGEVINSTEKKTKKKKINVIK